MDSAENISSTASAAAPDVLIPTLDPDRTLCGIVDELHERGIGEIIVVDDGSAPECEEVFDELKKKPFCLLVRHNVNRGKGAALRTAFMKYLYEHPEGIGCVTCDDDGQHSVDDIINIAETFRKHPGALLLGQRDFSGSDVPWKSRFGNVLTRTVFRLLAGIRIGDTQTGLRAIPAEVMEEALSIRGNRFEFETEMLLRAWDDRVEFREIPIRTVYLNNNSGTHFHPVRDAVRIYRVILGHLFRQLFRFALSGMASAMVDFVIFLMLTQLISMDNRKLQIALAATSARICSATLNFLLNRYWVFYTRPKNRSDLGFSALGYLLLGLFIFGASTGMVMLASYFIPYKFIPYAKAVIDTLLFVVSYLFQKLVVFRMSDRKRSAAAENRR
jgi:putative flippase GtrA